MNASLSSAAKDFGSAPSNEIEPSIEEPVEVNAETTKDLAEKVKTLFVAYDLETSKLDDCKDALERAKKAQSDACWAIYNAIAPKKKITRNGKQMTLVVRGDTCFMRGSKNDDSVAI